MPPIDTKIIESVKYGKCILFLGAMASAAPPPEGSGYVCGRLPPGGGALSEILAKQCEYPYEDRKNLQRVALFYQWGKGVNRRHALVEAIKREIGNPEIVASPALHMLAALPFRIIITTNYDLLFEQALYRAKTLGGLYKQPIVRVYDPDQTRPVIVSSDLPEEQPVLVKLHGDLNQPESIVITEEDYITFIQRMGMGEASHPIPQSIRVRMHEWSTLFIGYSLKDYNLRLLFKTLRWQLDPANYPLSLSVDPFPDDLIVAVWQHSEPMVSFVLEDLWRFVPELYNAVTGKDYDTP